MANTSISTVQFVYKRVIDETIKNSRETFLNEGIEESVLQELRTLWESKVSATRAVEPAINPPDYIPRGQIYKYNYRNQPPQNNNQATPAAASGVNVPFPGHISAFIPQTLQGQNISRSQPPAGGGGARPIIQHTAPNMRPNIHNAAGTARPNIHSVGPSMRPNIQSGVTNVRPGMHIASVRPGMHNTGQHSVRPNIHNAAPSVRPSMPSNSQYPANIPFPSLSGVTTVTKKEFNNASDSIQVDGSCDVITVDDDVTDQSYDVMEQICEVINRTRGFADKSCDESDHQKHSKTTICDNFQAVQNSNPKRKLKKRSKKTEIILQLDGGGDSDDDPGEFVDSEESDEEDNDDTDEEIDVGGEGNSTYDVDDINRPSTPVEEDDPLNSGDDDSDDGHNTEFEATDNVVVCLFDKVTRSKNKWKLNLKEGVMNIGGKDHVFHKAIGDGEW